MKRRALIRRGRRRLLRPAGFDELGLRRAFADRMLPFLVAAMAFLGALTLAGAVGVGAVARHWRAGAGAALTVQVPEPANPAASGRSGTRVAAVVAALRDSPGIAAARALTDAELAALLRPWLGSGTDRLALPLPAVIEVRLSAGGADLTALTPRLQAVAPGMVVESHGVWIGRLTALARSLEACAAVALLVVAAVAAVVIAVATRGGLAARRESIEIVHGLGATDGYIAARFASRATRRAAFGGLLGALAATPVLLGLADLAAPFAGEDAETGIFGSLRLVPASLWLTLASLPLVAAAIGFGTAQVTVRRWLRRLP